MLGIGDLETVETIDADHRDMTKFSERADEGYDAVRGVLKAFIRKMAQKPASVVQPPVNMEDKQRASASDSCA